MNNPLFLRKFLPSLKLTRYHKILGLRSNATKAQIKKAYYKLVKIYHPDRNSAPNAEQKFIEINEAYEYLMNPPKIDFTTVYRNPSRTQKSKSNQRTGKSEAKTKEQRRREWARARAEERAKQAEKDLLKARSKETLKRDLVYWVVIMFLIGCVFLPPALIGANNMRRSISTDELRSATGMYYGFMFFFWLFIIIVTSFFVHVTFKYHIIAWFKGRSS